MYYFDKFIKSVTDSLFPVRCAMCKRDEFLLCPNCEKLLKTNSNTLPDKTYAKYSYKDLTTKNILFKLKYKHHKNLSEVMGKYSSDFVKENIINKYNLQNKNYILVPIPLSSRRLKERGYNQAELISCGIDRERTLNILTRYKDTHRLKDAKNIDERHLELANSFDINKEELYEYLNKNNTDLNNLYVILIDDITTTGATFYKCKNLLQGHGFDDNKIFCFALAH